MKYCIIIVPYDSCLESSQQCAYFTGTTASSGGGSSPSGGGNGNGNGNGGGNGGGGSGGGNGNGGGGGGGGGGNAIVWPPPGSFYPVVYNISFYSASCVWRDRAKSVWSTEGCFVSVYECTLCLLNIK